jgi:mannonate dehydratase
MRVSVGCHDLSDAYMKKVSQFGVDCLDFGSGDSLPGVKEQGFPDLDELLKIKKHVQAWGMEINRMTLPDVSERYFLDQECGQEDVENTVNALRVFGEAGLPIARQRFEGDTFNHLLTHYRSQNRGGFLGAGGSLRGMDKETLSKLTPDELRRWRVHVWDATTGEPPDQEALDNWWDGFCHVYERLIPIAESYNIKLAMHPSDNPLPDTPFGGLGYHRIIDRFPNRCVGYLYCCGTRAEAGGLPLVLDEINNYGRKGRIFMVHFRNVRGSFATSGGYEEVLLDDGDMNMFKILLELQNVGFDGCINPDHIFAIEGDGPDSGQALSYAVGYIKALLAALAVR